VTFTQPNNLGTIHTLQACNTDESYNRTIRSSWTRNKISMSSIYDELRQLRLDIGSKLGQVFLATRDIDESGGDISEELQGLFKLCSFGCICSGRSSYRSSNNRRRGRRGQGRRSALPFRLGDDLLSTFSQAERVA
jgi:hypothetical protein